jgi:hypothetical protein
MSIVVFWLTPEGAGQNEKFESGKFSDALKLTESLRKYGHRHVTLSSEMDECVSKPGVSDELPSGYDWSKQDRAGCIRRGDADKPVMAEDPREGNR